MNAIEPSADRQMIVASTADHYARADVFADYVQRRAANTLRRQRADLAAFAAYLVAVRFYAVDDGSVADRLQADPAAWSNISYGLIAGFVRWQLAEGYAVASINVRLSTVKQYAKLAFMAGTLDADQHALIRTVTGYQFKEQKHVDEQRAADGTATRKGDKKARPVEISAACIRALKQQPNTAQGRRDALLMCLLLDHGLRCGEIASLDVTAVDLARGTLTFYRSKVSKTQTHALSKDTLRAARAWFKSGDAPAAGRLLRASAKSKDGDKLGAPGMTTRAITQRVEVLGQRVGVMGLSAHDGRHSWATRAAQNKTDTFALQEAGGWNSLAMPRRYVKAAQIANEGVQLGDD